MPVLGLRVDLCAGRRSRWEHADLPSRFDDNPAQMRIPVLAMLARRTFPPLQCSDGTIPAYAIIITGAGSEND